MGRFPVDFQEVKRPLRAKSVKRPIKVGKRPINEGKRPMKAKVLVGVSVSEGPKGGRRKGGRGRKLSHFSFCCAFRCVVYSPCFPVWGEEKVMTIYDAGPLAAGPLCGLLTVGSLMGCFRAPPPWQKTAPLKRPIKRSMNYVVRFEGPR